MNNIRAISTGAMIWLFIFITFSILSYVPSIKDSLHIQTLIVAIFIIPFAAFGAYVFYKNGNNLNGLMAGTIMSATAIVLDAVITVPLVELPKGGSYESFFTFPLFWLLVAINTTTIYFYWMLSIKAKRTIEGSHGS
ncbi:MAG: DUF5367 domain-containing protein [Cytophagaceae bacterium]|jgi:hypothetical protein|nr:DUF5367 domain-containing protein [Cytophagaceae bacterium]